MPNTLESLKLDGLDVEVSLPTPSVSLESGSSLTDLSDQLSIPSVSIYLDLLQSTFGSTSKVPYEVDGVVKDIEVWQVPLKDPRYPTDYSRFEFMRGYSLFSPLVFARKGTTGKPIMGMLSPNFDGVGGSMLPSIKVLALAQERSLPLIRNGSELRPATDLAMMLSGSAAAEDRLIGSHEVSPTQEYEHTITTIGAVSLGRTTILENGVHVQHKSRRKDSLDHKLTDGSLGNVFAASGKSSDIFPGYAMPLIFDAQSVSHDDVIYVPKALAERNEGYGVYFNGDHAALEMKLVSAWRNVYNAIGTSSASSQLRSILESA